MGVEENSQELILQLAEVPKGNSLHQGPLEFSALFLCTGGEIDRAPLTSVEMLCWQGKFCLKPSSMKQP